MKDNIDRDDIMDFFRYDEDCENIHSLSIDDRYELMIWLCEHSDYMERGINKLIDEDLEDN